MNFVNGWRKNLLVILFTLFLVVELPIVVVGHFAKPAPADAIIVLGAKVIGRAPSTMLRLRLDEAVKLYREGFAPYIIVSGARGKDEEIPEAEAMQNYLTTKGIPSEQIITESASYNTYQNLANSRALMETHGLSKAIIVSSSSHIHRSLVIARHLGMDVSGAPAPMVNPFFTTMQYLREGAAMLTVVVNLK